MSRILITTMPMAGHLRPCLPIAQALVAAGHQVAWYTGRKYAPLVTRSGAQFLPYGQALDWDDADLEPAEGRRGLKGLRSAILDVFIRPIPAHVAEVDEILDAFPADVVVAEQGFMAGPLAAERQGIPSVVLAVSPLGLTSVDTAPFGTGLPPASGPLGRTRNRLLNWAMSHLLFGEAQQAAEAVLATLDVAPIDGYFMDWGVRVAQRYLASGVPGLEYPRSDLPTTVEFVGALLPAAGHDWTPPAWWADVLAARASRRPVVLVTQGTLATDPDHLIRPAVAALAGSAALVVATTAGHDPADVFRPHERPENLRVEEFVPFTELLPFVDVMVTNGGFGGVQMALTHGVPVVVAGTTEDKLEVGARVTWSGTGVALRTDTPSPREIGNAVARVLADPAFAARAQGLQAAFASHGGAGRAAQVIVETAGVTSLVS